MSTTDVDFSEALFGSVVDAVVVVETGTGFLRHGGQPEMHGQNVLLDLDGDRVVRLVLRDHDAVRVHPRRLSVPDPATGSHPAGRSPCGSTRRAR